MFYTFDTRNKTPGYYNLLPFLFIAPHLHHLSLSFSSFIFYIIFALTLLPLVLTVRAQSHPIKIFLFPFTEHDFIIRSSLSLSFHIDNIHILKLFLKLKAIVNLPFLNLPYRKGHPSSGGGCLLAACIFANNGKRHVRGFRIVERRHIKQEHGNGQ